MRFKAEVQVAGDPAFYGNGLTFESRELAAAYAIDLESRWTQVVDWRVLPVDAEAGPHDAVELEVAHGQADQG